MSEKRTRSERPDNARRSRPDRTRTKSARKARGPVGMCDFCGDWVPMKTLRPVTVEVRGVERVREACRTHMRDQTPGRRSSPSSPNKPNRRS